MNNKNQRVGTGSKSKTTTDKGQGQNQKQGKRPKKLSEYGRQLLEKQKVKQMYGMREKQFRRFFAIATKQEGAPGENLLSLLERRLDNVLYRLKMSVTRAQSRQIVVHGHVCVNGRRVFSPSLLVSQGDVISFKDNVVKKTQFVEQAIDKRLNIGIKVPEWLELNKKDRKGQMLRRPVRTDIQVPIEEHLIVELYSK
ncbi:MAG: small subunit ribosomal protein S4 [Alteromonas naphthalenivorans]|jgi:small subunit ribosomal protein S4